MALTVAAAPVMAADTPQPGGRGVGADSTKWRPNKYKMIPTSEASPLGLAKRNGCWTNFKCGSYALFPSSTTCILPTFPSAISKRITVRIWWKPDFPAAPGLT